MYLLSLQSSTGNIEYLGYTWIGLDNIEMYFDEETLERVNNEKREKFELEIVTELEEKEIT